MRLEQCTHGILIQKNSKYPGDDRMVGMVVGVYNNAPEGEQKNTSYAAPLIEWQDGTKSAIDPSQISRFYSLYDT